jgi:Immune inhibitor A-like, MAM domain
VTSKGIGVIAALGVLALAVAGFALADPETAEGGPPDGRGHSDTKEIDDTLRDPADPASLLEDGAADDAPDAEATARATAEAAEAAVVGEVLPWVALDDENQVFYLKEFTLMAQDGTAQVWVASGAPLVSNPASPLFGDTTTGTNFPEGDCRNDGVRNVITQEQAGYILQQFSTVIRPTDVQWFDEPLARDGKQAALGNDWRDKEARDVLLIDNVRDSNFYDTDNQNTFTYIAGFFTTAMPFFHDRNVITMDAFDWPHRTGPDPLHEPSADPCTSAPARPSLYEGVVAHEYQHLIHSDYDGDELNWVNEGMADLAQTVTNYVDTSLHIDEKGNDSHINNFLGWASVAHPDWNPIPRPSGPENSLVLWEDQGADEVLEDYGFAYIFMSYLLDHGYGQDFFKAWHHNPLNGIAGLNDTLLAFGSSDTFESLFEDVIVTALADAYIDAGAGVVGETAAALQSDSLNSTIFFSGNAYDTAGAPPWGSDYLPLGEGRKLRTLTFDGSDQFEFEGGNDWTVDANGYWTNPDAESSDDYPGDLDSSIARQVSVPAGAPELTFEHWYQTENGWDFGFVQVLQDGDFVSLPCTGTTTEHNPDAIAEITAEVPGYTGPTEDPTNPATNGTADVPLAASCDLSAFAGQDIVLAFRLMSDPLVQFDGWHIRNVAIDRVPVDSTPGDLSDWDNEDFFTPEQLGFKLTLVGLSGDVDEFGHVTNANQVVVVRAALTAGSEYVLTTADKASLAGADLVVAIVSGVPQDEFSTTYAPYSLLVNNKQAADGAKLP